MALAVFHLCPAFEEESDFRFSTKQRCESTSAHDVQSNVDATFSVNSVHGNRLRNTSECLCSQVLAFKIALHQSRCGVTDHQRIGLSQSLNSRRDVGHITQCQLFLTPCSAHSPNHDQTRMYPKPYSELYAFFSLQARIQVFHLIKDTQASPYGSLGVVFMGLGIPKIDKKPVS